MKENMKTKEKTDRPLQDRRYSAVNLLLFVFMLIFLFLATVSDLLGSRTWPHVREARVAITNPSGETCHVAVLTSEQEGLWMFGEYEEVGRNDDLYWQAVRMLAIDGGMTENEADRLVEQKKQELQINSQDYRYEMYRELMERFSALMAEKAGTSMLGAVVHSATGTKTAGYPEYEVWKKIREYTDADGYRFIHQVTWKAGPGETAIELKDDDLPKHFKLFLYWPERGTVLVSEVMEPDHYVNAIDVSAGLSGSEGILTVTDQSRSETVPWWIVVAAVALFAGCEILVAWAIGARERRQLLLIACVTIVLHALLFTFLVLTHNAYRINGALRWRVVPVVVFKAIAFPIIEALIYMGFLREKGKRLEPPMKYIDLAALISWLPMLLLMLVAEVISIFRG